MTSDDLKGHESETQVFQQVLEHVFVPLLEQQVAAPTSSQTPTPPQCSPTGVLRSVLKLLTLLQHLDRHVPDDIRLYIPSLPADGGPVDDETIARLEGILAEWTNTMQATLAKETTKKMDAKVPLAEMAFWEGRHEVLGALYEQLDTPGARAAVALVRARTTDRNMLAAFHAQHGDLLRLTEEARDNTKFLRTAERHFHAIASGPVAGAAGALVPLLGALRLVWAISTFYSDDMRMAALLQRVAQQIADRAEGAIPLKELFHVRPQVAQAALQTSRALCERWYTAYLEVRDKIEQSGRENRWEFSKTALFERSAHVGEVCARLEAMLDTVHNFRHFLGPQLESMTGSGKSIQQLLAGMDHMMALVEAPGFNIFDKAQADRWKYVCAEFNNTNAALIAATGNLIDITFSNLRSAEAALELFASLKALQSGGALRQRMLSKSADIIAQFGREVAGTFVLFDTDKVFPPLARNETQVAGAIQWSRRLFARCRQTYAKLKAQEPATLQQPAGIQVEEKYMAFAREVMLFERARFQGWVARSEQDAKALLKQPVLLEDPASGRLSVNFSHQLAELIKEACALDRLGYTIPAAALHAALQAQRFQACQHSLAAVLEDYHKVTGRIASTERALLTTQLATLRAAFSPGLLVINWHSLGIPAFVASFKKALAEFQATLAVVQKNAASISKVITAIARGQLCAPPERRADGGVPVPGMQEFQDLADSHRTEALGKLVEKYKGLSPLLRKIEEAVCGSNGGAAPRMGPYYAHVERAVFHALNALLLAGMRALAGVLAAGGGPAAGGPRAGAPAAAGGIDPPQRVAPAFTVSLQLSRPDVIVQPNAAEVKKAVARQALALVESAKQFVRWMDGTCLEAAPVPGPSDDEEPFVHSFYLDTCQSPELRRAVLGLTSGAQRVLAGLGRAAEAWKRHQALWKSNKQLALDKFKAKAPDCEAWDGRMAHYARLADDVAAHPAHADVGFLRIDAAPVIAAVHAEALAWVAALSECMRVEGLAALQEKTARLAELAAALDRPADGLVELMAALEASHALQDGSVQWDLECWDLEEGFRTRVLHAADTGQDQEGLRAELAEACLLHGRWAELKVRAAAVEAGLSGAKTQHMPALDAQVAEVIASSTALLAQVQHIAAASGVPSVTAMEVLRQEARALITTADDLAKTQKLFRLPVTLYPALSQVRREVLEVMAK